MNNPALHSVDRRRAAFFVVGLNLAGGLAAYALVALGDATIGDVKSEATQVKTWRERFDTQQSFVDLSARLIPSGDLTAWFAHVLEIADAHVVRVLEYRPAGESASGPGLAPRLATFSLQVQGTVENLIAFLSRLERGPQALRLSQVQITRGHLDSFEGRLVFSALLPNRRIR